FVSLGEVHGAYDNSDDVHESRQGEATQHRHTQHGHAFFLIAEYELMNSQAADNNPEDAGDDLLVGASLLPILRRRLCIERAGRLNRLVSWLVRRCVVSWLASSVGTYQRQRRITLRTVVRDVRILSSVCRTR